ncbi:MAG TPA: transcriptional coactivator p15/PC4 family protein [Rhizomicrobium sp.]|jgi:hypothetical protein|nr:transcriptional coactivator p15/PC4 family protein [Rhizomicrobium sp.]
MSAPHPDAPADRVVRDIRKNSKETARIQLRTYEGVKLIDIRAYTIPTDGDPLPTKKGICLNVQCLRELIGALSEAEIIARQMGWLPVDPPQRKAA